MFSLVCKPPREREREKCDAAGIGRRQIVVVMAVVVVVGDNNSNDES